MRAGQFLSAAAASHAARRQRAAAMMAATVGVFAMMRWAIFGDVRGEDARDVAAVLTLAARYYY